MEIGKHICTQCNAVYEEPDDLLAPKRDAFETLPEAWQCKCGASKEMYEPYSLDSLESPGQDDEHLSHCNRKV